MKQKEWIVVMVPFLVILKKWANKTISFRQACVLSILAHSVLFLVLSVVVGFFEVPYLYRPPLVFDFVFTPVEEIDNMSQDSSVLDMAEQENSTEPQKASDVQRDRKHVKVSLTEVVTKADAAVTGAADKLTDSDIKKLTNKNPERLEKVESKAFSESETELASTSATEKNNNFERNIFINALKSNTFLKPRYTSGEPNLIAAKIFMTPRQQKMLFKKIHKWTENFYKMEFENGDSTIAWEYKDNTYLARFRTKPAKTSTGIDELLVEVTTEENGHEVATEMRMRRLAFSNFAQFVDYWDPRVAVHDDELVGRFHSNSRINISESFGVKPKFHGKVTTASWDVKPAGDWPILDEDAIFLGGLETGVKEIRLPKNFLPFISDTTIPSSQIHKFSEETWLTFHADGSYTWSSKDSPVPEKLRLSDIAHYFIGNKDEKLHLKGVVRGKVLVYSPGKIIIDGDLTYARHPEITFAADDYLGIVSDKDIEIAQPSVTGPGDLYIDAAIYAKERFRVRDLHADRDATLYIYGSLTAGSLSATEPRYATHIRFDKRLEENRPPNFPMTNRYELEEWDRTWKVKNN